nr:hypothetical protein [Tanacetum cinerariifolium]
SGEGSGVTPEVLDELTLKRLNEGASVIPEVLDELSDFSSSLSSDLESTVEDVLCDETNFTKKANEAKKAGTKKDSDEHVIEE